MKQIVVLSMLLGKLALVAALAITAPEKADMNGNFPTPDCLPFDPCDS